MKTALVKALERVLGVKFPVSYVKFIQERKSAKVDGFSVYGVSTEEVPMDVIGATEVLRSKRPDLPKTLIAIIMIDDCVCCLDLAESPVKDAPLVEVDLNSKKPPRPTGKTFSEWLVFHETMSMRFQREWQRIKNRQKESGDGERIQDWSAPIFRVKDYVIGIGAFKFNYQFGCLEVDAFLPIDQPHMLPGEALKILIAEMFARARDYTGSLNVQFTCDPRENDAGEIDETKTGRRLPAPLPQEIVDLAKRHGCELPYPEKGLIAHNDAVKMWIATL